jgi:hypothetical protein
MVMISVKGLADLQVAPPWAACDVA